MNCAWQAYLNLIPIRMKREVDQYRDNLLETRLRLDHKPILVLRNSVAVLNEIVTIDDLMFVMNIAAQYSPWATESLADSYITAKGGHRIGICGVSIIKNAKMAGIRLPTSVCIRVARSLDVLGDRVCATGESVLMIGRPGTGKTTLLRAIIQKFSGCDKRNIAVVDERSELFPMLNNQFIFDPGPNTDIISGCVKAHGVQAVLKNMNPDYIAVDEITSESDCEALRNAAWCGVPLLATAHAGNKKDLETRPIYKPIVESNMFQILITLRSDKTWTMERM